MTPKSQVETRIEDLYNRAESMEEAIETNKATEFLWRNIVIFGLTISNIVLGLRMITMEKEIEKLKAVPAASVQDDDK